MNYYTLRNTYEKYADHLKAALVEQTPSIVDFGTTMINKRKYKCKRNRRK